MYSGTEDVGRIRRRTFLDWLFGAGLAILSGTVLYPVLRYLIPPRVKEVTHTSVVAGKLSEMLPNSGKIFAFGGRPAILLRTPEGEVRAFSAVCTHLACTVQYRPDLRHIWCACHDGHYDLHGQVLSGPPPRPLEPYVVTIKGDDIIVSRG
ncbi:MAG: Rieske (2Fe-2S) protein [Armatimonadota bacterium]|nr:Rieske (2Fe-2S) protein [Armatimonadota bacterium]MDR7437881.1 Rieske (2Fe-2S) protein [Armatimonadota bacterium]MDR7473305.1 Rieske (2Fe-2S) protein [Armatimonadota bacterium]MDR7507645.1 Rieske (2Fe-2S) protein [Armatimonadota bacterium]MDR7510011.1 Rieske (2Fe-2S) protein [Armatimonadota bacterium]